MEVPIMELRMQRCTQGHFLGQLTQLPSGRLR